MGRFDDNLHEYDCISEDDAYYAEIRRQILLLTADDDDEEIPGIGHCTSSDISCINRWLIKGSSGLFSNSAIRAGSYFNVWDSQNAGSAPGWLVNQWRNGHGTGVFIPHIVKSIRRNKSGRKRKHRRRKSTEEKQL